MFDNLSESEGDRKSLQEAIGFGPTSSSDSRSPARPASGGLFGMSAAQRFLIALLLLLSVIVIGTMCLLVTGRISAF